MMVTFVSQCEKKALARTRRVLDAFADRIGDNTWQTVITEEGLSAVKKLLRKTASKSTAVSCHWIRSRSRSELLWVVGNKEKFNNQGIVPVNTTRHNLMQSQWENDWHYLPLIKAFTALAALLHDWGKATATFQNKLKESSRLGDPIRHEWISCLLFDHYVQGGEALLDQDWLQRLANGDMDEHRLKAIASSRREKPLASLPPAASLTAWLIVSHHRLPEIKDDSWQGEPAPTIEKLLYRIACTWGYENRQRPEERDKSYQSRLDHCFVFPDGLLSQSSPWLKQVKKWAKRLHDLLPLLEQSLNDGSWRLVMQHARLSLMLGDHCYSSQDKNPRWHSDIQLYANTDQHGQLKQQLDEHLSGVMQAALKTAHCLPAFEIEPPRAAAIAALKKKSPAEFAWQDKAAEKVRQWKKQQQTKQGCFIVNMASTGCGKTMANAKLMRALSDDGDSLRYVLALGLRTLTLQTGDEYRNRIGLDETELAVMIGSKAVMDLHNGHQQEKLAASPENTGSESAEALLDDEVYYDCDIPEEGLATLLTSDKARRFLYAPVLACTIDHIMPATETRRGGRYILPCLRLMSSDLVIDEVDDFTDSDIIAIGRLIHLLGMLGRSVMISSATIPPDLAEGFFNAYREGWQLYSHSRNASHAVCGIWLDEFNVQVETVAENKAEAANASYRNLHGAFVKKRVEKLKQQPAKRKGNIIDCDNIAGDTVEDHTSHQQAYFALCRNAALDLHHQHHSIDNNTGIQVSFGVIRVANIVPCIELTDYLLSANWPDDVEIRTMAYHSQQLLLLRHEQEKHLDSVLKRKEKSGEQPAAFADAVIRQHLDNCKKANLVFILVATPVEEVGRDHDFDWAVIEPSSYRSIIQLAGRVRRHRKDMQSVSSCNISLMQFNLRHLRGEKKAFCRPGYEMSDQTLLQTHDLKLLVDAEAIQENIDARPRITRPVVLHHRASLADLEHFATEQWLCRYAEQGPESLQAWLTSCWWMTAMPQQYHAFRQSGPTIKRYRVFDDGDFYFAEKDPNGHPVRCDREFSCQDMDAGTTRRLWLHRDYQDLLEKQAEKEGISLKYASLKYGEVALSDYGDNRHFIYNDQYGIQRKS